MEEIFKTISSSNKTSTDFRHTLLLAFYFKYYNIYKTEDKLSKNLIEHIWTVDELTADEIRRYKKYHDHFSFFLRSALDKYKHKLFSVIFSLLHKRLWEEFELKFFN